ncbi:MAG TPA: fasciclin domain-containing protein [Streptosporangiaceae bacterium]
MKSKFLATGAIAAAVALGTAACGSSGSSSSSAAAPKASASSAAPASSGSGSAMAPFGPACSKVPSSGAGSFTGMSTAPVATAASNNPVLSTLVTAVKKAGLVDTLNSASGITVFAPDNAAFARIPASTLKKVLANKAELTKILTYHVAKGRYTPAQLASGTKITTLEGAKVTPSKMGATYEVNAAHVACGDVHTSNATVYIIDNVLIPPTS